MALGESEMQENESRIRDNFHHNHLDYLMRSPEPSYSNHGLSHGHLERQNQQQQQQQQQYQNYRFPTSMAGETGPVTDRFNAIQLIHRQATPSSPSAHLQEAMKAVEIAESAIKEKMEENEYLKSELRMTNLQLQTYKQAVSLRQTGGKGGKLHPESQHTDIAEPNGNSALMDPANVTDYSREDFVYNSSDTDGNLLLHPREHSHQLSSSPALTGTQNGSGGVLNASTRKANQGFPSGSAATESASYSHLSSPSSRSVSPKRLQREGDFDSRLPLSSEGFGKGSDNSNKNNHWKEDMLFKIRGREEEILQLRKRLSESSIKELKILNEKHVLEKRISAMRLAFDQQQQDLVDAASKALSYRQDIMEENIRLTYSLQDAEQERQIFVSSLLRLLVEYDLQPPVNDAQAIVSNVKVLIQHLHERLNLSEVKLKDSQYQITTWRSEPVCQSPYAPQSPLYSNGDHTPRLNQNCLEIVPQSTYGPGQMPFSPQCAVNRVGNCESAVVKYQPSNNVYTGLGPDDTRQSPYSPNSAMENKQSEVPAMSTTNDAPSFQTEEENTFPAQANDLSSDNEVEDTGDAIGRSPRLPPVQEEPNSSVSGGEEELLPAIENLQIFGDAVPGNTLQACGFSINGTSVCVFQWVRHLQDGTMHYIEGAAQPEYTVTADDVDALLAIECFPMDERGRKGDLVKVFVNEDNKVTAGKIICDHDMQQKIETYFFAKQAVFDVQLSVGCLDIWEAACLIVKKSSYEIKTNKRRVLVHEKFSPDLQVSIPYGHPAECVISSSDDKVYVIATPEDQTLRDTIVLTMKLFKNQALERKGKKRGSFFNKIVNG